MKKTDKTYTPPSAEIVEMQTQVHVLMASAGAPSPSTTGFTATGAGLTGGSGIDDEF